MSVSTDRYLEFRSSRLDVTVVVLYHVEPPVLADALHKMLGGMPDFFSGEAAVLDCERVAHWPGRVDWPGLLSLFRRFLLQPFAVCNVPDDVAVMAKKAGLAVIDRVESQPVKQPVTGDLPAPPQSVPAVPQPVSEPMGKAVFIDRPLRSGQQKYARGADLVLLAGLGHGAEVIADGSIHCYGPLRGRALAGAGGNEDARILTTAFSPELVAICGVYKTFEQGLSPELAGRPVLVRLDGHEAAEPVLEIQPLSLD